MRPRGSAEPGFVAARQLCRYSLPMTSAIALLIATVTSLLLLAGLLLRPARTH
jgi:hypothetical protein